MNKESECPENDCKLVDDKFLIDAVKEYRSLVKKVDCSKLSKKKKIQLIFITYLPLLN